MGLSHEMEKPLFLIYQEIAGASQLQRFPFKALFQPLAYLPLLFFLTISVPTIALPDITNSNT